MIWSKKPTKGKPDALDDLHNHALDALRYTAQGFVQTRREIVPPPPSSLGAAQADLERALQEAMHEQASNAFLPGMSPQSQAQLTNAANQQAAQHQSIAQAMQALQGAGMLSAPMPPPPPRFDPGITKAEPLARKLQRDFDKLSDALPYSVVLRIKSIEARYRDKDKRAVDMVVFFDTGKEMVLPASNTFPTDADISRIIIECP